MKHPEETPPASPSPKVPLTNPEIARALEKAADLLEEQDQNPYRVRAFRNAARTVLEASDSVADLALNSGPAALRRLPGIGESLSRMIVDLVRRGSGNLRYRGFGEVTPTTFLTAIPGIGHVLARRILDQLEIRSLEDLETAIYEGQLESVPGFGPRRTAALRQIMNSLLGGSLRRRSRDLGAQHQVDRPPVDLLLDVDAQYRREAEAGRLRKIAPRRFNADRVAWLPILDRQEGGWTFRAMFSNTAQAHALGRTHDWVVVSFERAGERHSCTVVTEVRGTRAGRRVVRGRESEGSSA